MKSARSCERAYEEGVPQMEGVETIVCSDCAKSAWHVLSVGLQRRRTGTNVRHTQESAHRGWEFAVDRLHGSMEF